MSNPLFVMENTYCYECYQMMKTHNINYLRVVRDDKILGTIKKSDVKELLLFRQFEAEEDENILDEFRKTQQ